MAVTHPACLLRAIPSEQEQQQQQQQDEDEDDDDNPPELEFEDFEEEFPEQEQQHQHPPSQSPPPPPPPPPPQNLDNQPFQPTNQPLHLTNPIESFDFFVRSDHLFGPEISHRTIRDPVFTLANPTLGFYDLAYASDVVSTATGAPSLNAFKAAVGHKVLKEVQETCKMPDSDSEFESGIGVRNAFERLSGAKGVLPADLKSLEGRFVVGVEIRERSSGYGDECDADYKTKRKMTEEDEDEKGDDVVHLPPLDRPGVYILQHGLEADVTVVHDPWRKTPSVQQSTSYSSSLDYSVVYDGCNGFNDDEDAVPLSPTFSDEGYLTAGDGDSEETSRIEKQGEMKVEREDEIVTFRFPGEMLMEEPEEEEDLRPSSSLLDLNQDPICPIVKANRTLLQRQ
jgi:hypothetical protein